MFSSYKQPTQNNTDSDGESLEDDSQNSTSSLSSPATKQRNTHSVSSVTPPKRVSHKISDSIASLSPFKPATPKATHSKNPANIPKLSHTKNAPLPDLFMQSLVIFFSFMIYIFSYLYLFFYRINQTKATRNKYLLCNCKLNIILQFISFSFYFYK